MGFTSTLRSEPAERFSPIVSPYSLIELDLLVLSRKIKVEDPEEFSRDVIREPRLRTISVAEVKARRACQGVGI